MSQAGSQAASQVPFTAVPWGYPGFAPQTFVRGPSYNERYVAWKNRQKAFNKYKKLTRRAIKDQRNFYPAPFFYGGFPGQEMSFASAAAAPVEAAADEPEIRGTQV